MKAGTFFFDKKIIIAAAVYFSVSAILLFKFGIQLGGEAEKFIENANRILNGQHFFNGVFGYFYIIYSLLVALFIKLSVNLVFVAVVQIVLSFFAALCLYKLLQQVLDNSNIAFLFFVAYLLCYPIQKWNFFLYSESVHTSLLLIGVYCFNNWLSDKKFSRLVAFGVVLVLIFFSRPVGILFLMSFFVVLLFWLYQNKRKMQFYVLTGISIVSFIIVLNSPFTAFVNPDSIRRMEIICQVPESDNTAAYAEYNRVGLYRAFDVIKNEIGFVEFFKSGFKKLGYFFGMYRSYYSWQNNLLLICFTVVYPFAFIGMFSKQQKTFYYTRLFALVYLLFTSIGIFFTCDEWSNRFISPAFPFILILAAGGLLSVFRRIRRSSGLSS
jgi:Dolichyl-phosphate-mannose-protein mannosyltransferase